MNVIFSLNEKSILAHEIYELLKSVNAASKMLPKWLVKVTLTTLSNTQNKTFQNCLRTANTVSHNAAYTGLIYCKNGRSLIGTHIAMAISEIIRTVENCY